MATRSVIPAGSIPTGTGVTLLARLRGAAGALVTQASLSSIAWTALELTAGTELGTGTWTVSEVVYDSLQQGDPRWSADDASNPGEDGEHGFNFAATVAASLFASRTLAAESPLSPLVPKRFQVEVVFTPTSGQPFTVVWQWREQVTYGG